MWACEEGQTDHLLSDKPQELEFALTFLLSSQMSNIHKIAISILKDLILRAFALDVDEEFLQMCFEKALEQVGFNLVMLEPESSEEAVIEDQEEGRAIWDDMSEDSSSDLEFNIN